MKGRDDMSDETDPKRPSEAKLNAIEAAFFHKAAVFSLETLTAFAKAMEEAYELGFADAEQQRETTKDAGERYPSGKTARDWLNTEAYNAGVDAAKAKKRYHENPYPYGVPENDYWRDGFYDAGGYRAKPPIG
jgi:hypothetical protein